MMNTNNQLASKSIKKRVVLQFFTIVAISILSIISLVVYYVSDELKIQAQKTVQSKADLIQDKIENRLDYLIESTKLLAKHELMINSLVDDDGRKGYLTPLIQNFMDAKNVLALNVVDFDGIVIFESGKNIPQYKDSVYLRRALAVGDTTYYLNKNTIVVISPIKYYNTTQGSLIAEFDFDKIVDKYRPSDSSEYIKLFKSDEPIYSYNFSKDAKYYSYRFSSDFTPVFNKLEIVLEMGILESIYLAPVKSAVLKLLLFGLMLLAIGMLVSYLLSISITNPILKLYGMVKDRGELDEYTPLGTEDELEKLAEAFYERTKMLQKSEKIYSNLYNNSPDMYLSLDNDNEKIIECNKTLLEKLGYSKEEIIGKDIFKIVHTDSLADLYKLLDDFKLKGNVYNKELQLKSKDASSMYVLFSVSIVKDKEGEILHTHAAMRDITEIKEHEKQLKENETLLFQQSKMASMGEMIGNIAHQWRQPLSTITMSSVNLRASIELEEKLTDEDIVNYAKGIEKQCQYLSKTIDDFRNFFTPNKEKNRFNIKESIEKTIQLVSASFTAHEIELFKDIKDIEITAFENELTQAILNIVKNSKDVLEGIEDMRKLIFIKTYEDNNTAYIEVLDNGGGVPEKIINKVFDPYFTTKHKSQGTGIGLYMTEAIVTKHLGGRIYVKNVDYDYEGKRYKGAKFTVEIPLEPSLSKENKS